MCVMKIVVINFTRYVYKSMTIIQFIFTSQISTVTIITTTSTTITNTTM